MLRDPIPAPPPNTRPTPSPFVVGSHKADGITAFAFGLRLHFDVFYIIVTVWDIIYHISYID
jgi:hypothetical protein